MKKIAIILMLLVLPGIARMAAATESVRIIVDTANVRSLPSLEGKVLFKAARGDVFVVTGRSGDWFKVQLPAKAGAPEGYINETVVEKLAAEETSAPAGKATKPAAPARAPQTAKPAAATPADKLFSGFAAKFGYMTAPAAGFGDRWLLAFTFEKGLNPFLAAGFELQPYFRSFSEADFSSSTLGANLFLNAKGGVNLGRFIQTLKFLTPYAGVGLGGAFAASSSKLGGEKASQTDFRFAWHLLFGFEVKLKKLALIYEIQAIKIPVKEVDPDRTQYYMMLGIRF